MSILNRANNRINTVINDHKVASNIIAAAIVIAVTAISAAAISHSAVMAEAAYDTPVFQPERASATSNSSTLTIIPGVANTIQGQQLQPASGLAYQSQANASSLQPNTNDIQLTAASPQNAANL